MTILKLLTFYTDNLITDEKYNILAVRSIILSFFVNVFLSTHYKYYIYIIFDLFYYGLYGSRHVYFIQILTHVALILCIVLNNVYFKYVYITLTLYETLTLYPLNIFFMVLSIGDLYKLCYVFIFIINFTTILTIDLNVINIVVAIIKNIYMLYICW